MPPWKEHLDRSGAERAPDELERLGEFGPQRRLLHRVLPTGFVTTAAIVDCGECEFATALSGDDNGGSFPPHGAAPVISTKPRSLHWGVRAIEPLTPVTLRTPVAHASDVGDEVVHDLR